MASFSEQLPTPSGSKPIINPEVTTQAATSPFVALANAGGDFIQALNHRQVYNREQAGAKAAAYRLGQEQQKDQAFSLIFRDLNNLNSNIPSAVQSDVTDLGKAKAAEAQGKIPAGSYAIKVDQTTQRVASLYPEQALDIYKEFHAMGIDHPAVREAKLANDIQESDAKAVAGIHTTYLDIAAKNGLALPGMTEDQIAQKGQEFAKLNSDLDEADKRQKIAMQSQTMNQQEKEFELKEANRQGISALNDMLLQKIGPITQSIDSLFVIASNNPSDPRAQKDLENLTPKINAGLASMKTAAYAALAKRGMDNADNRALIDSTLDGQARSMKELFTSETSNYAITKRSYETLKNTWALDDAKALPVWSRLKGVFGIGGLQEILGGTIALPPEVVKGIQQELMGFKTSNVQDANEHLARVAQMLTGATGIKSYSEAEARKAMPTLVAATAGNAKDILTNKNDSALPMWSNGYSNLVAAAGSLTPGSATEKELNTATGFTFNPYSRVLIDKLVKNPETAEQGKALALASSSSAEQVIINYRHLGGNASGTVEYKGGAFVVVPSKASNPKSPYGQASGPYANMVGLKQAELSSLTERAKNMNQALDHITELQKYNEGAKGVKSIDIRNHFAVGTALPQTSENQTGPNATQQFRQEIDRLDKRITELPSQIQNDPNLTVDPNRNITDLKNLASNIANQIGVPDKYFQSMIGHESTWDPTASAEASQRKAGQKVTSHAFGLGQLQPDIQKKYGVTDPSNPEQNLRASAQYLKDLHDKLGSWEKALDAYSGKSHSAEVRADILKNLNA
jgi:hypothetical protein